MIKINWLFLGLCCWASALYAQTPFKISCGFRPPVSDFSQRILEQAFAQLNKSVVFSVRPTERSIRLVNQGFEDADCFRVKGITGLYPDIIQVPEAVYFVRFSAFSQQPSLSLPHWRDLKPYRVGTVYGFKLIENKVNLVAPKTWVQLSNTDALFHMLYLNRLDVAVIGLQEGLYKLRQMGLPNISALDPPLASMPLFLSLHKKHANLVEPLTQIFKQMKKTGEWQLIFKQFFNTAKP